ncbi:hypothetical protein QBC34DRAFT_418773 [Podospora aff. communis PSN243]|uniref:Rhodopsin domain-containing protein n=1 Tax=Podospora aff. communis PSN243 TaxID=3040156 RepID=A0AAV9FZF7_9PEZI|nr:hypothetical protein QBC34DRAFT_418773 [Podospora aff. communis PSN243]
MSTSPPPPPPAPSWLRPGDRLDAIPLASIGALLGIACTTTILRIYWRVRPTWRIGSDDATLAFALILTIAWYGITAVMYSYGRGVQGAIPTPSLNGPLIVATAVLWVWALNVIRISVGLMLLRLKDSRRWKITLWTIIAVQICMLIVGTTMHLVLCNPISDRWALPGTKTNCMPLADFQAYGYVYSAFTIASDLILSLLPLTFIRSLHRPLHEKVLIGCLMAAGLAATAVAVTRLFVIMGYGPGAYKGAYFNMVQDLLWGFELTIGILAASVPTLKAPIHRMLLSWGVLKDKDASSDASPESFLDQLTHGSHFTRQMRQWDGMGDPNRKRPYMFSEPKGTDGSGSTQTRVNDGTPVSTVV